MSGRYVDVLKHVKSLIGHYTDVIQSWMVGCNGRPGSFPTTHVLCRLSSHSPSDLTTSSTTALHPRPLPIVLNSSKQPGTAGDTSTKFTNLSGPSKTHPVLSRLPYDFTRPLPTIKAGKGRLSGRLSVTEA